MTASETLNDRRVAPFMGLNGVETYEDTISHRGQWTALIALEDTTFTSLARRGTTTSWSGRLITEGKVVYGFITEFTLTSGAVDAVKAGN